MAEVATEAGGPLATLLLDLERPAKRTWRRVSAGRINGALDVDGVIDPRLGLLAIEDVRRRLPAPADPSRTTARATTALQRSSRRWITLTATPTIAATPSKSSNTTRGALGAAFVFVAVLIVRSSSKPMAMPPMIATFWNDQGL
ncbi:hypothetical protein [Actinomycetospora callitridis]|uniref:hypothetical protein n=1 Tax=Actinomycetospora callitridis TaxID=913944 RepID=UPI002365B568|nr:hypothetical protein [Actinomycetospora callitridis]MDD7921249.1 hypothetical protein [Actinomycetospora callitridis]